ncbi:histone-lysine N-methyltransferase MECOM-like [Amblyomma americanum]
MPVSAVRACPELLTLGKSTVNGCPVGVFTLKALPKGLHFGPYQGVKVDDIENGGCTWPVRRCGEFFVVDGRPQQRNHWMNDVNYSPSKRRHNLVALFVNGDIYYRTLKNVGPGEEMLVRYSTSFAKSLLGNPREPGALNGEDVNIVPLHSLLHACEKCGDLFSTQYKSETHTRRKHWHKTEGIRRGTHCPNKSSHKADIIRHARTHVDKRKSMCHVCKKRFSKPDHLKVHMMIHSGEKPYECGQCGKRFRQRVHARRHEEVIHFRRYPLTCQRCGAGAEDVFKLRHHTCKPLGTTEDKEGLKRCRGRPRLRADGTSPKVRPQNTTEGTPLQGGVKRGRGPPRKAVTQDASAPRA